MDAEQAAAYPAHVHLLSPALTLQGAVAHVDVRRTADLLQISSGSGRAMETVDRSAVVRALHPVLAARQETGTGVRALRDVVADSAQGHAFPTDLDRDAPIGGMAPQTRAEPARQALEQGWSTGRLDEALDAQEGRRHPIVR